MNRREAKKQATSQSWTWEQMRGILIDARIGLCGRTGRVNPVLTDRDVWEVMDRAVATRSGEINRKSLLTVQNILREFS